MKARTSIEEKHYKVTCKINSMLLGVHICLLALFWYLHITAMVYVNIVSVSLYVGLFFFYKRSLDQYIMIALTEALLHMALATMCVGWDAGFQLYSFCLIPCIFLCDYLGKIDGKDSKHPVTVSVLIVAIFLATKGYCNQYRSVYELENTRQYIMLFIYNAVVSFVFLTIYIAIFEKSILTREKKLGEMAEVDALTKLPNRYLMGQWLQQGYESMAENNAMAQENAMAIAMLDVDDFKQLNDRYGHMCGDLVLKTIAAQITSVVRQPVRAARWGGEEFLFMHTGENAYENLKEILENLRDNIAKSPVCFHEQEIFVTVTIGIASYDRNDSSYQDIIMCADECMYEGKEKGKNRIVGKHIRS